jgi:hypothetical protein
MADNVRDIFSNQRAEFDRARRSGNDGGPVDSGGGPPHDGGMEERVKNLEKSAGEARAELRSIDTRLTKIEVKLDSFSTTADLHKEISAQTWKLVTFVCGFGTALVAATYFIAKHAAA